MGRITDIRIFILVCLNAAIYVLILIFDVLKAGNGVTETQGIASDFLKYAAVVSCLLICVFALSHDRRKVALIQMIVFCITLCADFFLLFTNLFSVGVIVFIFAHLCALYRYRPGWVLPAGISATALFIIIILFLPKLFLAETELTLVLAASFAYTLTIIIVAVSTFHSPQPRQNELFSRLGMLLFIGCDLSVLSFNALMVGSSIHTLSIVLMWFFYLPAQTLLALSAINLPLIRRKKHIENLV
jgi:hypothetical protein